jgi:hypothetical protein
MGNFAYGLIGELKTAGRGCVLPVEEPSPPRMPTVGRDDIFAVVVSCGGVGIEVVLNSKFLQGNIEKLSYECTKPFWEVLAFETVFSEVKLDLQ